MQKINYEEASKLYASGLSINQVAAMLSCSGPTILRALERTGTKTRSISDAKSLRSRGNRRVDNGYITVCHGKGLRKKEHVLIAEKILGRALNKNEVVHHIDGNTLNNKNDNLLICTRSYHTWLHWRIKKAQQKK
jgi:hypothetical protein